MLLPTVAIVGRPNVGKSRLFNRLAGRPVAIVDPTAGVTRDRIFHEVERDGLRFDLIDTGGIGIVDAAKLEDEIETQIERAIANADRIIFMVDARSGPTALDETIAQRLRPHQDRVVLAANKLDHPNMDPAAWEFAALGMGEVIALSAEQNRGIDELCEALGAGLPTPAQLAEAESATNADGRLKICLAGRRNVGKSSMINALAGEQRVIVADYAGTTRDAVDVRIDHGENHYLLIDTAGLRKKKQLHQDLEFYAACRTERAIRRADVLLLILDATEEIGNVDKKLAHFCEAGGKPTVVVVNKWDLAAAAGGRREDYVHWLRDRLPGLGHAPVVFTCALTGENLGTALSLADELFAESSGHLPTAELNRLLEAAVQRRRPRRIGSGSTKLYYATQADTNPPTFVVFVNRTDWVEAGYGRYLANYLRDRTPFGRVPIRIVFKARDSRFHEHHDERVRTTAGTKADRNAHLIVPRSRKRRQSRRH